MSGKRWIYMEDSTDLCYGCKKYAGSRRRYKDHWYCNDCIKKMIDERESTQYYNKLFVDCPFCGKTIDITENYDIKECPYCKTKVYSPKYCGFCEEDFTFYKDKI